MDDQPSLTTNPLEEGYVVNSTTMYPVLLYNSTHNYNNNDNILKNDNHTFHNVPFQNNPSVNQLFNPFNNPNPLYTNEIRNIPTTIMEYNEDTLYNDNYYEYEDNLLEQKPAFAAPPPPNPIHTTPLLFIDQPQYKFPGAPPTSNFDTLHQQHPSSVSVIQRQELSH